MWSFVNFISIIIPLFRIQVTYFSLFFQSSVFVPFKPAPLFSNPFLPAMRRIYTLNEHLPQNLSFGAFFSKTDSGVNCSKILSRCNDRQPSFQSLSKKFSLIFRAELNAL